MAGACRVGVANIFPGRLDFPIENGIYSLNMMNCLAQGEIR